MDDLEAALKAFTAVIASMWHQWNDLSSSMKIQERCAEA